MMNAVAQEPLQAILRGLEPAFSGVGIVALRLDCSTDGRNGHMSLRIKLP